ncbi:HPr(Ser) kinase/phosphatase [Rhodohalobacter sp. SW132]|uniref:HPr(Ser) kinase/phosphatase n=1 Tax=Rhodohalobacter sp. SW132 TaxID=2293433 RepID=UPI000E27D0A8|nr:HPr(Ser) kinase/phosphatase [Rhodohalobacter sp. SW132]REL33022.1 HPr(Ser) kinase/phosphatase [Rhodohalobacter sp. SW132]
MSFQNQKPIPGKEKIAVASLIDKFRKKLRVELKLQSGENRADQIFIRDVDLHRPGLALAGYIDLFTYQKVQIIGNTESRYLENLSESEQVDSFKKVTSFDVPIFICTAGNKLPDSLLQIARDRDIPIAYTPVKTSKFMFLLRDFLEDYFAVQTMIHGTMVDVYGIGILISGKSGIGKSEVALDLVERGHRLVSDDVVMLTKKSNILIASATEMNKHFMEIRGLGIINVMSMFGIRSIRYQKRLEVILELNLWEDSQNVERTGLDNDQDEILDTLIPLIKLPITPGKNITVIAEVIAMNYLLKHYGYDAAEEFQNKVHSHIARKKDGPEMPNRAVEYFEGDFE